MQKILIRLIVLCLLLVLANEIYRRFFWKEDLKKNDSEIVLTVKNLQESADIMYFGESSDFSTAPNDSCLLAISKMTAEYFPDLELAQISKSAHHARYFVPLVRNIRKGSRVSTVILTLNMRTFDMACIHGRFETALCKMARMYEPLPPLMNRFLLTLNYYDNRSAEDRDKEMWEEWTYDTLFLPHWKKYHTIKEWCAEDKFLNPDGSYDVKKRELADHYIKAYAFIIDTLRNPRIKDFDYMVDYLQGIGKNVVLNLMDENRHYADSLIGQDLVDLMEIDRKLLIERYTRKGAIVVDNFGLVDPWDYTDQNWTTEHYGQKGRSAIAANLAKHVAPLHPGKYQPWPLAKRLEQNPAPVKK